MEEIALADLTLLEEQVTQVKATGIAKKSKGDHTQPALTGYEAVADEPLESGYLVDYLKVNLEVWDSGGSQADQSTLSSPIMTTDFGDSLRLYASKLQSTHSCSSAAPFKAIYLL